MLQQKTVGINGEIRTVPLARSQLDGPKSGNSEPCWNGVAIVNANSFCMRLKILSHILSLSTIIVSVRARTKSLSIESHAKMKIEILCVQCNFQLLSVN